MKETGLDLLGGASTKGTITGWDPKKQEYIRTGGTDNFLSEATIKAQRDNGNHVISWLLGLLCTRCNMGFVNHSRNTWYIHR